MKQSLVLLIGLGLLVGCGEESDRLQPPWPDRSVLMVVSNEAVDTVCPKIGSRIACYASGVIYVRPHEPNLPVGRYELRAPPDWQPPPWPAPRTNREWHEAIRAGRILLEYSNLENVNPSGVYNRAAHIAHEFTHDLGFKH